MSPITGNPPGLRSTADQLIAGEIGISIHACANGFTPSALEAFLGWGRCSDKRQKVTEKRLTRSHCEK
jgi:hypothetical protein